jgi:hypothetical protein
VTQPPPKLGQLPLISCFDKNKIRLGAGFVGSLVHLIAYLPTCIFEKNQGF